jgi:outer membrane protein assembly factor BamE (lipoprotein component of BamABCDE complex)
MKTTLMIVALTIAMTACGKKPKDFSTIKTGMTKDQVTFAAGNPDKQNDIGETSFWAYRDADRTVVFRKDTVYTITTSTEARLDSINDLLQKADNKIANGLDKMGNALDSTGKRIKRSMDSLNKK